LQQSLKNYIEARTILLHIFILFATRRKLLVEHVQPVLTFRPAFLRNFALIRVSCLPFRNFVLTAGRNIEIFDTAAISISISRGIDRRTGEWALRI